MTSAGHIDLYQLTSLVDHHASGRSDQPVTMAFFSRRLPRDPRTAAPVRGYLLWAGLSRCLDHLADARFSDDAIARLQAHPVLGPALATTPDLIDRLRAWRFTGRVRAPREGTPLFAGLAVRADGTPLEVAGVRPAAYCPYLVVETDLLSAKLIETPLLSLINHMTMVATKASLVVQAASGLPGERAVLEFGQRRTHPEAAVDAALAAYIGGCAATSNVEAHLRHGIPISGTMDHFAIQAWEQDGVPRHTTEHAFFASFSARYPGADVLLVDTYDTFGERTGIRNAVRAAPPGPHGIRIDSALSRENLVRARALLDDLGATHTKIFVSGGMDEHSIRALGEVAVDGYGVGERIVTSPDAPVGVGAVAKLAMLGDRPTMKLSRGSGKATLPGRLQVWRTPDGDTVGLEGEERDGIPLLETVWDVDGSRPSPSFSAVRDHAQRALAALSPDQIAPRDATLRVSEPLAELVDRTVRRALD
jgi:nicotinate phosphoribosyltransferase